MTMFKDLEIGATFDFIGPDPRLTSFYRRCVKLSSRTYTPVDGEDTPRPMRVGSVKCEVYHVEPPAPDFKATRHAAVIRSVLA